MNYDWQKAVEVFYSLTDTQLVWLDEMIKRERKAKEYQMKDVRRRAGVR